MNRINPIYHHSTSKLLTELDWINAAKEDINKFHPLYEKYYAQIFNYIRQRMDDNELAFDVTSQVFLKAMKNLNRFEYRGVPFGSWLYRIAKSELNQAFRDRTSKRTAPLEENTVGVFMEVFQEEENQLNKKRLHNALAKLKEKDLAYIKYRFFQDLSYREIGELTGVTENNAKVRTFRALEKLKNIFSSTSWHKR